MNNTITNIYTTLYVYTVLKNVDKNRVLSLDFMVNICSASPWTRTDSTKNWFYWAKRFFKIGRVLFYCTRYYKLKSVFSSRCAFNFIVKTILNSRVCVRVCMYLHVNKPIHVENICEELTGFAFKFRINRILICMRIDVALECTYI